MTQTNIAAAEGLLRVLTIPGARGALHDVRPDPISSGSSPAPRLNDGFMEQLPRRGVIPAGAFYSEVTR